jgi:UDP-N-acetylmuramate--alanine ligase
VGGVLENYDSNLIGRGKTVTVVEADEFDRSFLHLHPDMACVTSTDADHLDIYGDARSIEASFQEFAAKIDDKSNLFVATGLPIEGTVVAVNQDAPYKACRVRIENGAYVFDVQTPTELIRDLRFSLPGTHNLTNALMALAMAKKYSVSNANIAKALASFKGIRRRFSFQIQTDELVYIDDYAHHPTEINAVHQAVRELYPGKKVLAVFQPHLFSRTQDFGAEFAKSLSQFDRVILLDIYPARELPIDGITSQWVLDQITNPHKSMVSKADLVSELCAAEEPIIVTIGAGDIGEMVKEIKTGLEQKSRT